MKCNPPTSDDNTDIQKGKGSNFFSILQNTGMIRVVNYLQLLLYSKLPMMNVLKIAVQISTYPSEGLKAIAFGISSFPSISRTILQLRKSPR